MLDQRGCRMNQLTISRASTALWSNEPSDSAPGAILHSFAPSRSWRGLGLWGPDWTCSPLNKGSLSTVCGNPHLAGVEWPCSWSGSTRASLQWKIMGFPRKHLKKWNKSTWRLFFFSSAPLYLLRLPLFSLQLTFKLLNSSQYFAIRASQIYTSLYGCCWHLLITPCTICGIQLLRRILLWPGSSVYSPFGIVFHL